MKPLTNEQIEELTDKERLAILDEAIDTIIAFPENWNQSVWRCQTGFCLAGHIAEMYGSGWQTRAEMGSRLVGGESAGSFAARVLDLSTYYEPSNQPLFEAFNTIYDLIHRRNEYAQARHLPSRRWSQKRLTRANRIANGTNAARNDILNWNFDFTPDAWGWQPSSLEARAYRAERKRQKSREDALSSLR